MGEPTRRRVGSLRIAAGISHQLLLDERRGDCGISSCRAFAGASVRKRTHDGCPVGHR
ncbi:(Fe-S)-binding protein [Arthrobacter sp. R4]|uniref:(Fe-S)-binding protein n=1 Tax=Arthrobacter sp. R4 TaxID=644417 RepID=UPI003EDAA992